MGAGRARLVRQLLTENLLLAALGGLTGLLLAEWCLRALIGMGPRDIPRLAETAFDWQVGLFAGAITLLTGLFTGFAPIWTAGKSDLVGALKDGARSATGGKSGHAVARRAGGRGDRHHAGAYFRRGPAGAQPDRGRNGAIRASLPSTCWRSSWCCPRRATRARRPSKPSTTGCGGTCAVCPESTAVGAVNCPPSAGDCGDWFYSILDGPAPQPGEVPIALFNIADRDYFSALRIPLREGRGFSDTDQRGAPPGPRGHRQRNLRAQMVAESIGRGTPHQIGRTVSRRAHLRNRGRGRRCQPDGPGYRPAAGDLSALLAVAVGGHGGNVARERRSAIASSPPCAAASRRSIATCPSRACGLSSAAWQPRSRDAVSVLCCWPCLRAWRWRWREWASMDCSIIGCACGKRRLPSD